MNHLAISLLGPLTVQVDGETVTTFGYDKVCALLAYLVTERGHPLRREHLTGLLWPDTSDRSARQSLSQALSTLRTVLGDRANSARNGLIIEATRQTVCINPDSDVWVDIQALHEHIQAAHRHAHGSIAECESCLKDLSLAAELYRGDFLADLSLGDSPPFEEWALLQREQLRRRALEAMDLLAEAHLVQEDYQAACRYGRRQLALDPWRESAHCQLMRALALDGARNAALAQYETCREILATALDVEPEPATEALYESIRDGTIRSTTALTTGITQSEMTPPQRDEPPPFRGLRFFNISDADLFFGREALTDRLVRRVMAGEPFLTVIGASGSGKSSLLRAGLVAQLQRGAHAGSQELLLQVLTPTARPLQALCRIAIAGEPSAGEITVCRDELLVDANSLRRRLSDSAREQSRFGGHTLLVVDQFEELFSLCRDPVARRAFVNNLINAASVGSAGGATWSTQVVIALRADFYHHCADYEALREILDTHQTYIGAMTREELRRAILGPANHGGWTFDPGLVDLLLHDVGADGQGAPEPGALPLLSHALLETWKRREGRTLTLKGYADAGGVRGAIAQSAESVYRALNTAERRVARGIFLRLTELGEAVEDPGTSIFTRRRASLDEIAIGPAAEDTVRVVLDTLARARLITMERDAVEVAHEALIREWPTLRAWLQEDLEGLRIHRQLTEATQAWEQRSRDPSELYRGARLARAREWSQAHSSDPNALERAFLAASEAERARIEDEREQQHRRELAAAQRAAEAEQRRAAERGRLLRWIGLAAALLLVATVIATVLGSRYRTTAEEKAALADLNAAIAATAQAAEGEAISAREEEARQRVAAEAAQHAEAEQRAAAEAAGREAAAQRDAAEREARANLAMSLAGQAAVHEDKNSNLALLLALEANAMQNTPQTRGALLSALERSPGRVRWLTDNEGYVNSVAVSPDGKLLVSADGPRVVLRDAGTGKPVGAPLIGLGDWVSEVAFVDGGRTLAALVGSDDEETPPEVRFWEVSPTGEIGQSLGAIVSENFVGDVFAGMAISPDGRSLVLIGCKEFYVAAVGWHFCRKGGATLWDFSDLLDGGNDAVQRAHLDYVTEGSAVAFHPGGETIAIAGCARWGDSSCIQGFTQLWDPDTGEITRLDQHALAGTGMTDVEDVAFTPDGAYLVTVGCGTNDVNSVCSQSRADLWDLATYESIAQLTETGEGFFSLAVSPDSWTVALGSYTAIHLWTPLGRALAEQPLVGHTNGIWDLAFTPDGQMLFSAGDDRLLGCWDLTLRGGIRSRLVREWVPISQLAFDPTGEVLAAGSEGMVRVWDAETGEQIAALRLLDPKEVLWDVAFSPDGTLMATASVTKQEVRLWDRKTWTPIGEPVMPMPGIPAFTAEFSPDGRTLATSGAGPLITLVDVDSLIAGVPVSRTLLGHEPGVGIPQVVFSPDGALLASAGTDGTVRLWDVAAGLQVGEPLGPNGGDLKSVAFSPDGTTLASAGQDASIRLWDVETHELIALLPGHDFSVWRIGYTPDGNTLASIDDAGHLRLWDMSDPDQPGRPIGETLQGHLNWAWGLAISPDGKTAITTARSGEVQRWHIDPAWWRERACAIAGRNLTQAEWAQYIPAEPYHATCGDSGN